MTIQTFSKVETISSTGTLSTGSIGFPKTDPNFLDTDGSTPIDGMLIPLIDGNTRTTFIISTAQPVLNIEQQNRWLPFGHHTKVIYTVTNHGFVNKQKIALTNGNELVAFANVFKVIDNDNFIVRADGRTIDLLAVDAVNSGTLRHSGVVTFGNAIFNLGSYQSVGGELVRLAFVLTDNPDSGDSFITRKENNEVLWSKVYNVGTVNVTNSWCGLSAFSGYITSITDLDSEKRLMLVTYVESTGGAPISFGYSYQLTIHQETTFDKS